MKRYNSYKDSGVEWMGKIPEDWDITRIGYSSELTVPQRDKPKDLSGPIPWLRIEDFDGKYVFCSKSNQGVSQEVVDNMNLKVYPIGTVLTACSCTMGMTAIVKKPLITNQTFIGITPSDKLSSDYLYYFLLASTQYLNSISSGAIQSYLSRNEFSRLKIPKLPKEEQTQIAKYLDHKTAQLDNLIAKKEQLIKLLEEERIAIINQAVTKGLDPKVPMKDSGIEWLGEIPKHWVATKIKFIAQLRSGDNITSERIKSQGAFPVYGGNGLRGYYNKHTNEGNYVLIGRQGALCGNIKFVQGKFWASEHAVVCYLDKNHEWIWFGKLLESMNLNQYNQSAAQPGLAVSLIKNLQIPLPPTDEQKNIVQYIQSQTERIKNLSTKVSKEIDLLKEYKTTLISDVVTGKIDVRDA